MFIRVIVKCKLPSLSPKSARTQSTFSAHSAATNKRKLKRPVYNLASRSEPHMNFKDVSYIKNKTHQLRVAKIQKSKEEEAAKGGLLL